VQVNPHRPQDRSVNLLRRKPPSQGRQGAGRHHLRRRRVGAGDRDGDIYGNRWRDARPQPVAGDVSQWLAHVERMVPEKFEREHLLNALAHKVQFPAIRSTTPS
jgi:hypothetical protein